MTCTAMPRSQACAWPHGVFKSVARATLFAIECSPEKRVAPRSPMEEASMPHIKSPSKSRSLIAGVVAAATLSWPALAGNEAVPNFMSDARTGWIAGVREGEFPIGDEFLQPLSGPGPVKYDPAHPFIDNAPSSRSGKSPTTRAPDLTHPTLLPWDREELKKLND